MKEDEPGARVVYLDHNATTPPHADVVQAMVAAMVNTWANPSSVHGFGQSARAELDRARTAVAALADLHPRDVLFTSGGTEANNIALRSFTAVDRPLVTTAVEHPSVLATAELLRAKGIGVGIAHVGADGRVTIEALEAAAKRAGGVGCVSLQAVNHETGSIQPVQEVLGWARSRKAVMHVDAIQAVGKVALAHWHGVDAISVAAHKIRGPKGIGALVTQPRVKLFAQMGGGAQERGLRPGTQCAALAAGFRVAAERALDGPARYKELQVVRDQLESALIAMAATHDIDVQINGAGNRAPHVTNQSWDGFRGPELCAALDLEGLAISSGAACSAGTAEPSTVITAIAGAERAISAIRLSLGEGDGAAQRDFAVAAFRRILARRRSK